MGSVDLAGYGCLALSKPSVIYFLASKCITLGTPSGRVLMMYVEHKRKLPAAGPQCDGDAVKKKCC